MLIKKNNIIEVGDKVNVFINGKIKQLEVVDVLSAGVNYDNKFSLSLFIHDVLGRGYLERINVKMPDGKVIECRPVQPMF